MCIDVLKAFQPLWFTNYLTEHKKGNLPTLAASRLFPPNVFADAHSFVDFPSKTHTHTYQDPNWRLNVVYRMEMSVVAPNGKLLYSNWHSAVPEHKHEHLYRWLSNWVFQQWYNTFHIKLDRSLKRVTKNWWEILWFYRCRELMKSNTLCAVALPIESTIRSIALTLPVVEAYNTYSEAVSYQALVFTSRDKNVCSLLYGFIIDYKVNFVNIRSIRCQYRF